MRTISPRTIIPILNDCRRISVADQYAESGMSEASNATKGCLGVFGFLGIAGCVIISGGPSDPPNAQASAKPEYVIMSPEEHRRATGESSGSEAKVTPEPAKASGPIKLSDLDESDRAIRRAINVSGHLCAKPIEVVEAGTNLYGVQCITNRDGSGRSTYLVNSRTNDVTEI